MNWQGITCSDTVRCCAGYGVCGIGARSVMESDVRLAGERFLECERGIDSLEELGSILSLCGINRCLYAEDKLVFEIKRQSEMVWSMPARDIDGLALRLLRGLRGKVTCGRQVMVFALQGGETGGICGNFSIMLRNAIQSRLYSLTGLSPVALNAEESCLSGEKGCCVQGKEIGFGVRAYRQL